MPYGGRAAILCAVSTLVDRGFWGSIFNVHSRALSYLAQARRYQVEPTLDAPRIAGGLTSPGPCGTLRDARDIYSQRRHAPLTRNLTTDSPSKIMFKAALRSARPAVLAARAGVKPANAASLRALSTTAIRRSDGHHASAPSLYGTGAKEGEVPTDEAQSTGLDRVQVLGNLEGVEVFDLNPLDASRIGTLADPIKVFSVVRVLPPS